MSKWYDILMGFLVAASISISCLAIIVYYIVVGVS